MEIDIIKILTQGLSILVSVQFGSLLICVGSIIYAPTGSKLGKYSVIAGLIVFTLNIFNSGVSFY